jgi:hypothetical protein
MDSPPDYKSAQSAAARGIKHDDKPFRVALVMCRASNAYVDSRGDVQPARLLKVKCGSIMMSRSTTEKEFRRLQWECIYKVYNLHAWKEAPLTDAELASGSKNVAAKQLRSSISHLAAEKDKGIDPVYHLTFVFKKGERVKMETESQLSFTVKRMLDLVFRRW